MTDIYEETVERGGPVPPAAAPWYDSIAWRLNAILWAVLVLFEGLLVLRFALLAFGASRQSGFVNFIRDVSWPLARPFAGAFSNRTWDQGVIEVSTLLAMAVWLLVFAMLSILVNALAPRVWDRPAPSYLGRRRRITRA